MNLSYRSEYKGEVKTLKLKEYPSSLGHYKDINDDVWDVNCIIGAGYSSTGKGYINARLVDINNPYYSTANDAHSNGHHEWLPYYVEVIKK